MRFYVKIWHFVNFSYIFFGQKCLALLKLTDFLRLAYDLSAATAGKAQTGDRCWSTLDAPQLLQSSHLYSISLVLPVVVRPTA